MDFEGPNAADLVDIAALNRAYLEHLRARPGARSTLPGRIAERISALSDAQIRRLAELPLLLPSLRERDSAYWAEFRSRGRTRDLFAAEPAPERDIGLAAATLAYAWQLARRDPHTARLVCAAPGDWCEQLAELPLIGLLDQLPTVVDPIVPRLADHDGFWRRLLDTGISEDRAVRRMAHLTAVQVALTVPGSLQPGRLAAAACRTPAAGRARHDPT